MPITELQTIVIASYTIVFIIIVAFFEIRLNYIHRRHVEKLWPIGEDGLKIIDRKLKIIVRCIFLLLFLFSLMTILTLL